MLDQCPFDFTRAVSLLCSDIAERLDEFQHVKMEHVAVSFAQTRRRTPYGLQAKLTPMRFENGSLTTVRRGQTWTIQRLFRHETEILYVLTFYLPRFLNQTFREKMITVLHELYHISPEFNGDIRRMSGRYHVHSHSQKEYDRRMEGLVEKYIQQDPPKELLEFLKYRFRTLQTRHGGIVGLKIPIPKLILVPGTKTA